MFGQRPTIKTFQNRKTKFISISCDLYACVVFFDRFRKNDLARIVHVSKLNRVIHHPAYAGQLLMSLTLLCF